MSVQRIEKIEQIIIKDPESPTGLTSVGFNTYYTNCIYVYYRFFSIVEKLLLLIEKM